jgi:hypothetical protein
VHGEQDGVGLLRSVAWCAGARGLPGASRELLQFLPAARVAEYDVMAGAREDRPELPAHQPRAKDADSQLALLHRLPVFCHDSRPQPVERVPRQLFHVTRLGQLAIDGEHGHAVYDRPDEPGQQHRVVAAHDPLAL